MPWQKGQSGNPGGKPAVVARVRYLARKYSEDAIKELHRLALQSEDDRVRLSACQLLLERGLGKPVEEVREEDERVVNMSLTPEELRAAEQAMLPERADEQAS